MSHTLSTRALFLHSFFFSFFCPSISPTSSSFSIFVLFSWSFQRPTKFIAKIHSRARGLYFSPICQPGLRMNWHRHKLRARGLGFKKILDQSSEKLILNILLKMIAFCSSHRLDTGFRARWEKFANEKTSSPGRGWRGPRGREFVTPRARCRACGARPVE